MDDVVDELTKMGEKLQSGFVRLPPASKELGAGTFNAAAVFNANLKNDGFVPLFRSQNLNQCVFRKAITRDTDAPHIEPNKVATKICLPYSQNSYGKDHLFIYYGEENFQEKFERAFNVSMSEQDRKVDHTVLDILDSIPTFDPFLMRDRFEIEDYNIDDNYLKVSDADFTKIKNNIMGDFEKIVRVTMQDDENQDPKIFNKAASKLFKALWDLDDMDVLRPLSKALGVSEKNQKEYFYSWKGILFYVYRYRDEFTSLEDDLVGVKRIAMSDGLGNSGQISYQLKSILGEKATLNKFLENYQSAFDAAFVERSQTENFLRILNNARPIFWTIGTVIGRLDLYTTYFRRALSNHLSGRVARDMREFLDDMER